MNIAKYFDKNSKKRDLSGDSNPEEERKKIRDGSSASNTDNCDVFEEGLESPECKEILFNCLRNLQEKVTEIFNLAQDTKNMQIKGDKQLEELKSSVEVMSDKFDEYEKDRKEKEKIINGLQNEVSFLKERIDLLEKKSDDSEQYSRRNCLLVHGVEEQEQENTDNIVLNVIKEHLDIELSVKDFDKSHRIGKSNSKSKRRPIIVKFISYNDRRAIFNNKKRLKGTGISITESLTAERMRQLKSARDQFGFNNVWSIDGRIMYKGSTTTKPKLFYG